MANENLRAALERAGLTPDDLAQIVAVDVRTVRRWLSGGTPYPRQRAKVARAVDITEHDLWPDIATAPVRSPLAARAGDAVAGYPAASDLSAPDWKALMRDATDRIELLGNTLSSTLATTGVSELLATKASRGCRVRILLYDAHEHLTPLLDHPGIEIRLLERSTDYTIHFYDDQLLLTLHMVAGDFEHMPLIHLRRAAPDGLFDRLTEYYNDLCEHDSRPLEPRPDNPFEAGHDDGENLDAAPPVRGGEQPAAGRSGPSTSPLARRWPRRPPDPPKHDKS